MAEEPENLTLRILQELRTGMDEIRSDLRDLRAEVKDISTRLNGNTIMLSTVAGLFHDHEERISKLEAR